jgi:hypothetical protein
VASGKRVSDSTSNQLRKSGISAIFADELAIETVASEQVLLMRKAYVNGLLKGSVNVG